MATHDTIPGVSRAARQRRQEAWERGAAWYAADHTLKRALADATDLDEYERYLFLLGIAQTLTAAARDIAGIDRPKED